MKKSLAVVKTARLYSDILHPLKGEPLSSGFSIDAVLNFCIHSTSLRREDGSQGKEF